MRIIPTQAPTANMDGGAILAQITTGPTKLEISLTPHEAMTLGHSLIIAARQQIAPPSEAELIAFPKRARV